MPLSFHLVSNATRRPQVLSKYGALWQHMFRLTRVQLALEGAWATLQVPAAV